MLLLPMSEYVKTPYYIRSLSVRVYSIEELAYIICDSALRIDESFMSDEMISFVDKELKCQELASKLREYKDDNNLALFCRGILLYTAFAPKEQIDHVTNLLSQNQSLSPGNRSFRRGNYFMKNDLILQAMPEYASALKEFGANDEKEKYADCLYNLGVANARIFDFERSAKYFLESYEISLDESAYNLYLASKRLGSSKDEYLTFIRENDISEEKIKELEDWIGVLLSQSLQDDVYKRFAGAIHKRNEGKPSECYEDLFEILGQWKTECRRNLEIENI